MDSFNPLLSFRSITFLSVKLLFFPMVEITEKDAKLWFSIKFESEKKAM